MRRQKAIAGLCAMWLVCVASCARKNGVGAPIEAPKAAEQDAAFDPGGVGVLDTRTEAGDVGHLALKQVSVVATQREDMADVAVEHTFANDSDVSLEGTFRFPMPDGAILTGLAMMIGGKWMDGELVERDKARKVYEAIVDSMQDPALLEWEHGSTFKMRVFPIEAHQDKRVIIRYLAPLRRTGDTFEYVQGVRTASGSAPLAELVVKWNGAMVVREKNVAPERLFAVPAAAPARVMRERRADGVYTAVRLGPAPRTSPKTASTPKNWFVVVDTSRSSLEERALQLETLNTILGALPKGSRFQTITSDLDVRVVQGGLAPASPASVIGALQFARAIAPDGASDLGKALTAVGELAKNVPDSAAIYIGDCEPTWGITKAAEIVALAKRELAHTPLYPVVLGASADEDLAEDLAAATGGRRARVRRREDLDAFAKMLAKGISPATRVELGAPPGTEVFPAGSFSLEPGKDTVVLLKSPVGQDPLGALKITDTASGRQLDVLPRGAAPKDTKEIARRFGASLVASMQKTAKPAADIVKTSIDYGVMSKLTSFLVLESEEAYAQYAIARKARAEAQDAPRVTGANLESTDERGVDVSLNRIQPGDPEIFVDAERDAKSVRVEFPWGETKVATYDPEARNGRGAFVVRFLVSRDTPEGLYEAIAYIVHRDGSLERRVVTYTVDRSAPELDVRLSAARGRPGQMELVVVQRAPESEVDLRHVEVQTPAGRIRELTAIRWGTFRAFIPRAELAPRAAAAPATLRVVGFDEAQNHSVTEVPLP